MLRTMASRGESVTVQSIRVLTGQVISMSLAMPLVRCWTRSLYRLIAIADTTYAEHTTLDQGALWELTELILIFANHNGALIKDASQPLTSIFCDAGESGWGLHLGDREYFGPFPATLIGTSSTRRELEGVLAGLYAMHADTTLSQAPHTTQVNLDSLCAVRNLVKGGGPKADLCLVVKHIFTQLEVMHLAARFNWVPREHNTHADTLSKMHDAIWILQHETYRGIEAYIGLSPTSPRYNGIRHATRQAVGSATSVAFIIPLWRSQSWWPYVAQRFNIRAIAPSSFEPIPNLGLPPWEMGVIWTN
jgi:hypothetical protein